MKMLLIIVSLVLSQTASAASTVQAYSKAGQHPLTCTGGFGQSGLLQHVGYLDTELRKGIPCEMADFDGNGSNDFFFTKCQKKTCKTSVILMNKIDVIKAIHLKESGILKVYTKVSGIAPHRPDLEKLGCKMAANDMLTNAGPLYVIYSLKKDQSNFEKFSECK